METLLRIMRAEPGYRGRYIGERLRACNRMLDQLAGTPVPIERDRGDSGGDVDRVLESLVGDPEPTE